MSWLDTAGVADDDRPVAALVHDTVVHPAGWRLAHVVLDGVTDKATLIAAFAEAIDAPDHMGANWDAVVDVLGDRSDAVAVVLDGEVADAAGRDLSVLLDIVDEQTRIGSPPTRAVRVRRPG